LKAQHSVTLQRSATHCNSLQHPAIHRYNTGVYVAVESTAQRDTWLQLLMDANVAITGWPVCCSVLQCVAAVCCNMMLQCVETVDSSDAIT